jgi:type VI protein secretion system component Hcp
MRQTRLSHRSGKQDEATRPRASAGEAPAYFGDLMSLQSTMGNAAVGNLVRSRDRATQESPTPIDAFTQSLIAGQTGGSEVVASQPGGARIHQGPESDTLTRMLGATGFTQGQDVFLRSDRDPSSDAGRATLAHEMAHVAQGSIGPGAVMREPDVSTAVEMDTSKGSLPAVVAKITTSDGDFDGGSQVTGHQGEIDLLSCTQAMASPGVGGTGNNTPQQSSIDLTCSRTHDVKSVELMKAMLDGKIIKSARFTFLKRTPDGTVEDGFALEFKDGLITGYQVSGENESISFNFKERG